MNNRDKYKKAFSVLRASETTDWEALMQQKSKKNYGKTTLKLLLLVAVISLMTVTVSADSVRQLFGWGGNMEITDHGNGVEIVVNTDELTEPVEIRNGRMYFIVNGRTSISPIRFRRLRHSHINMWTIRALHTTGWWA